MAAPHYMPLFIADYEADTLDLSLVQHGAYLRLLMLHWKLGPLPTDERRLAQCIGSAWRSGRSVYCQMLVRFFANTQDGWVQKRLMREREYAVEVIAKRKKAAASRWHANAQANGDAQAHAHADATSLAKPKDSEKGSEGNPFSESTMQPQVSGRVVRLDGARARRSHPEPVPDPEHDPGEVRARGDAHLGSPDVQALILAGLSEPDAIWEANSKRRKAEWDKVNGRIH